MIAHASLAHLASLPILMAVVGFMLGLTTGFLTWYFGWGKKGQEDLLPSRQQVRRKNR